MHERGKQQSTTLHSPATNRPVQPRTITPYHADRRCCLGYSRGYRYGRLFSIGGSVAGQTFAGFNTAYTVVVDGNSSLTTREWPGLDAGIRRLDRITAVNETDLPTDNYAAARAGLRDAVNQMGYGDTVEVQFLRPPAEARSPKPAM